MIGQTLGSYKIEAELGAGAMGIVYRGVNVNKGTTAAIKTIHKEVLARGGKAVERFQREMDLLEQFRHPNIVRYYARGRSGGINYFAMEYIVGDTLDTVVRDKGGLDWKDVARYGVQLCSALDYAHERSVIHRDLKPSNLMVNQQGQLKLTDFGIAKDLEGTALTAAGRTLGTAAYMAPEQITGTPDVSHKTDLYALGVVLYELLTGETPFKGETVAVLMHRHMTEPPPRPSNKTAILPVAFDDLVIKLMSKTPKDRPWDAAAVALELQKILDKAAKGEKLLMAWPEEGSPESMPTRAFTINEDRAKAVATPVTTSGKDPKTKSKSKGKAKTKRTEERSSGPVEGASQAALLVGGLILIGGLIGYVVWPTSAAWLHDQAAKKMVSPERTDWLTAQTQFLEPLDRRFPDHPYKADTDAWFDKISLSSAQNRADYIKKANTPGEEVYLYTVAAAKAAADRGDDLEAARLWQKMADDLKKQGKDERGWLLLAGQRARSLEKTLLDRKETVAKLLRQADDFEEKGSTETAIYLRRKAIEQYARYTDVADLIVIAKSKLPAPSKDSTAPDAKVGTDSP